MPDCDEHRRLLREMVAVIEAGSKFAWNGQGLEARLVFKGLHYRWVRDAKKLLEENEDG